MAQMSHRAMRQVRHVLWSFATDTRRYQLPVLILLRSKSDGIVLFLSNFRRARVLTSLVSAVTNERSCPIIGLHFLLVRYSEFSVQSVS
jgi:hypothetical protein